MRRISLAAVLVVVVGLGAAVSGISPRASAASRAAVSGPDLHLVIAPQASVVPAKNAEPPTVRPGDSGRWVSTLQSRLAALGYWIGDADARFGSLTTQAVYALQKAAGLRRDGVVGPRTWAALERGVRPSARSTRGTRVEVNLSRQLLLLVENGRVKRIFNTSTGSGEVYYVRGVRKVAVTPRGTYRVYRRVNGWDPGPLGSLYRPAYFNGGIAVHGFGSVPTYPASHGCVRVSIAAMNWLWNSDWLDRSDIVQVY